MTAEFALRFNPSKTYAMRVAEGFFTLILEQQTFTGWKGESLKEIELSGVKYQAKVFRGNLDSTSPERPDVAIFQFNIMALRPNDVKIIPQIFFEYYGPERWNPFLCLSLMDYLIKHQGDVLEDQKQVSTFIPRLREFALLVLLSDQLESVSPEYTSRMVGSERIKDLLKKQCQGLYPHYKTLIYQS